ncbi:MAG: acylphosphatase [Rhodospirillaceae bacterium]|nr:acylphosphatase [Rhodospirillaceae bacterium]
MTTGKTDNVIPFRSSADLKKKNILKKKKASTRGSPTAPQFPHHDRVVRISLRGLVKEESFIRWLVEEAVQLHLDGWARNRSDGEMDVLLAGEIGDVRQMLEFLREGPRPVDMLLVEEKPLHGDEPLWSGFHHLSPSEV